MFFMNRFSSFEVHLSVLVPLKKVLFKTHRFLCLWHKGRPDAGHSLLYLHIWIVLIPGNPTVRMSLEILQLDGFECLAPFQPPLYRESGYKPSSQRFLIIRDAKILAKT